MQRTTLVQYTILLVVCFLAVRSCMTEKKENTDLKETVAITMDSSQYYKYRFEHEYAEKMLLQESLENMVLLNGPLLDSVSMELNILKNSIEDASALAFMTAQNQLPFLYQQTNTNNWQLKGKSLGTGLQDMDPKLYGDSITGCKSSLNDNDSTGLHPWAADLNGNVKCTFPYCKYDRRKYNFNVGPFAGLYFNGHKVRPAVGISIQYSLFHF